MKLTTLLFGGQCIAVPAEHRLAVLNLCLQNGFSYTDFVWCADGSVRFWCTVPTARRLLRYCKSSMADVRTVDARGIPWLFWMLRKRIGLAVGVVCALSLLVLSGQFVWDIDITGNEQLSAEEIRELLRACGFGVGTYLPNVHTGDLENRVLLASDQISWIAVNLNGTVANVQVLERIASADDGDAAPAAKPANLIAISDGQVEFLELYRGTSVVKIGQAVKKGDLLVSGIYEGELSGLHVTRASGAVWARTERTITVEIPLNYEEKVYEDEKIRTIFLNFFDFSVKIFENTGNQSTMCDIIEGKTEKNGLFARPLPVSFTVDAVRPYTLCCATRSAEEAIELAYDALERELSALSDEIQLLQKQISADITEDSVRLSCTLRCVENIAVQQEFEIGD